MSFDRIEYAGLTFTDDEIVDGEAFRTLSLLYDALEIGTFTVELYLTDPDIGTALAEFRRNAKLLYYHREQLRGTYYVESVARTGKYTYQITANDALSLLDQSNHMGGIYTGQTVAEVVSSICNIPYLIQSKLSRIRLYGWLPIATRRSNLAQVLFAIGGVAKVDQNGVLRIETLWNGMCSNIPESRVFWGDKVNYASKVTEISVLEHQYIMGTEEIKLFEGATVDGDVIQFSEPAHSLTAQGFRILEQGANYARVSGGSGTLTGLKYIHTTRDVREPVSEDEVPNVVEVTEATLVSLTNSAAVAQRLAAYYRQTESVEHETVYDGEAPGDVVTMTHPYGGAAFGCISEASISLGRSPVAAEKVALGYVPPIIGDGEILEERVVLTGTGTWTPPEGVESVRAVLIGAGQRGEDGEDGTVGILPTSDHDSQQNTQTVGPNSNISVSATANTQGSGLYDPEPGKGGAGGAGGLGGKILQVEMDVSGPIAYSCGTAAAHGEDADSVFGDVSSADGERSQTGFVDPITGETFAKAGKDGIAGGDGGGPNASGADAGSAKGGAGARKSESKYSHWGDPWNTVSGTAQMSGIAITATWGNGAGGGGAGGNGEDGGSPYFSGKDTSIDLNQDTGTGSAYTITGGPGGNGKNGASATSYGSGGDGGNGGGGAGQCSSVSITTTVEAYWFEYGSNPPPTLGISAWAIAYAKQGGTPVAGVGGIAGDGMDGCIIIYYAVKRKATSGAVRDQTGRMVLDRLGRRIVV